MGQFVFYETEDLKDEEIWLELLRTMPEDPARGLVPAYYFKIRSRKTNEAVGMCDLRVGNRYNIYYAGNIGYQVYERFRGRHYASRACRLLFRQAAKHGMEEVVITCSTENTASKRTCELAGAVCVETVKVPSDNEMYKRGYRLLHRYVKRLKM